MKENLNLVVAGGGSWGTALAHILAEAGHKVVIFLRDAKIANEINTNNENTRYLPNRKIHANVSASTDKNCLKNKDFYVLAIPCQQVRSFLQSVEDVLPDNAIFVNSAKGLECPKANTVEQIVKEVVGHKSPNYAVISGPSFAAEVLDNQPTAVVLACNDEKTGQWLRNVFSNSFFRCYSCSDVIGAEIGGALKNIIAIAAGVCDGLGLGYNSRAALLTRGLAEMSRLGLAMGANVTTFMGLSGLGDLILTCTGDLSRNRQVGLRLGKGEKLNDIVSSLGMVSEGVKTTEAVYKHAQSLNIRVPITSAMYAVLYEEKNPQEILIELMSSELKDENM